MAKELHFYRWDCKDYLAESTPMSDAQDLYYRRLMDLCALRGGRIDLSDEAVCRAVRARSATQKRVALEVLRDFFQGVSGAYSHPLIDRALALHEASASGGRNKGSKGRNHKGGQPEKANTDEKSLEINDGAPRGLGSESQAEGKQSVVSSHESLKTEHINTLARDVAVAQGKTTPLNDVRAGRDEVLAGIKEITGRDASKSQDARAAIARLLDPLTGGHSVESVLLVTRWAHETWKGGIKSLPRVLSDGEFAARLEEAQIWAAPAATPAPVEPINWLQHAK